MIGLFSFDGPMYRDCNGVYCNTTITSEMFSRYFSVVDKLIVVIRTFHLDKTYEEANLKKVELEGLEFIEIPNLNSIKGFLIDKRNYKKIIAEQVEKSDLIFARMPSIISDITIDIARKNKKKYMVEVGGCSWDAYWNHSAKGKIMAPYVYYKQKIGIENANFASYVTEKWLQERYPCKCNYISASNVYLKEVDEFILEQRLRKIDAKRSCDPTIIGTVAAVNVKYKGQEYIIKAISKLNREGYNFEYELVGGGDNTYLNGIAKKYGVEDKVRFKGLLLHHDVFVWLDSIDIYAQPSKQEGLPRALIESMSRGCPAIGSTTAGIPELLSEKVLFNNGKVDEICKILKSLDKSIMSEMAEINYKKSKEFHIEVIEKRRQTIFNDYAENFKKNN